MLQCRDDGQAPRFADGPPTSSSQLEQLLNAVEWNLDPNRPIVQFVAQFVNGFFEQVRVEENIQFGRRIGKEACAADPLKVGLEKRRTYPAVPKLSPWLEGRQLIRVNHTQVDLLQEGRMRSVVERADHACDIAHRRTLDPPLAERPGRFAFEVDNDEIFPRIKNLAQMIVAMTADPQRVEAGFVNRAQTPQDFSLGGENALGRPPLRFGK